MSARRLLAELDLASAGAELYGLVERAYPICRSITGEGVRATLALLGEGLPLEVHEVPTGTHVLDWEVPREWNVREAWIEDPAGRRVVDFADHNLHLLGYSAPFRGKLSRAELDAHLFSIPDRPELIPYRTSYYEERWGFCLAHRVRQGLIEGDYEVQVDTALEDGSLTYGEVLLPGRSQREVLFSCHVCHPSLANDNLSALAVTAALARRLAGLERSARRYSYRFLFVPGTIGAITWLARNSATVGRIDHGLVAANLGGEGGFHYKQSRRGDAEIDRAVPRALADLGHQVEVESFIPFGYDERQYGSPGFNLPVGSLTRTPWGRYPEYHTSADNLELVRPDQLAGSLQAYLAVVALLEANHAYRNLNPHGEPQLGRRGLYRSLGGDDRGRERELALLWVLNQSDGEHSLLDIATRSGVPFVRLEEAAVALLGAGLLAEVDGRGR